MRGPVRSRSVRSGHGDRARSVMANRSGFADGLNVVDPPLTDRGHLRPQRLAELLSEERFDEILVSPLRARPPDGGTAARRARTRRGRRPVAGGDPRPDVARHAGGEGGRGVRRAARPSGRGALVGPRRWRVDARVRRPASASGRRRFLAERGVVRSEVDLPIWQIEEPGARILLDRPRRHELGHHRPPARPAGDAVGVGPLRPRAQPRSAASRRCRCTTATRSACRS